MSIFLSFFWLVPTTLDTVVMVLSESIVVPYHLACNLMQDYHKQNIVIPIT